MDSPGSLPYTICDPPPGCTCGPYWSVIPPGPCPHHQSGAGNMASPWIPMTTTFTGHNVTPPSISDDDVERIARRVVELLKERE